MAYALKIGDLEFKATDITAVQFCSNTPNGLETAGTVQDGLQLGDFNYNVKPGGGNARSSDYGLGVKVWGRINFSGAGDSWNDATVKLAEWALQPSDAKDAYREAEVHVGDGGQQVRKYTFDKVFIVEYSEELDDESGMGHFYVHLRQKKDYNKNVKIEGGYSL